MSRIMQQPQEVHLLDPLKPIAPQPFRGCDVCSALVKEWIALTEPASPEYNLKEAERVRQEVNEHRRRDEAKTSST